MRRRLIAQFILVTTVAAASTAAGDLPWAVEAGIMVGKIEGVRSYSIPDRKLPDNDTPHLTARYVRITRALGDRWSLGLGYAHYNELRGSGFSGSSDIFDRSQVSLPVVVPLEITDRVEEVFVDGRCQWTIAPHFALSLGPVVSYFDSKAEWGSTFFGAAGIGAPIQKFYSRGGLYHESDLRLGGAAGMTFGLTARMEIQVDYRYATSPRRDLHLASAGLRWRL